MGAVRGDPDTRDLFIACMREVEALARARGIALKPGIVEESLAFADGMPPGLRPSMLNDLERGRSLELEALNGTVVRMAREANLPVPVNQFIFAALKFHAAGRR
jgi:2-dehydropantoate 2-reductase